jgi:hypothetical protein
VLHIDVEVADHHDAAVGPDALLAARELAGLHVALHDVDAVLLIEGNAGHLVEADDVVLADQAALAVRHVHEHARDGGLAAGEQVRVGRDLLEKVALAGAARAELDQVVVALHERDHAQQDRVLGAAASVARAPGRCCAGGSPSTRVVVSLAAASGDLVENVALES